MAAVVGVHHLTQICPLQAGQAAARGYLLMAITTLVGTEPQDKVITVALHTHHSTMLAAVAVARGLLEAMVLVV